MWEIISVIEEKKPGDTDRPFPVLRRLDLDLPACSPLVLRFVSCLSAQLQNLSLGAADHFAAQEGREGAESGDNAEGRRGHEGDMDIPLEVPPLPPAPAPHLPRAPDIPLPSQRPALPVAAARASPHLA
ncbi:unnamed protein product [Closterium sp. Naga37s-1]|nr:unnamed protein product [Closterium sp. Naga37s-1]